MLKKIFQVILIVFGSATLLLTTFKSGWQYSYGIGFWGPNGHDGVWHLALSNQAAKGIPPGNPVFSGTVLKNYHWGYDFLAGGLARLTGLPVADVHFRLLPIVFSLYLGIISMLFGIAISGSFWVGFFFAFLNYFAGSLGWLIVLLREGRVGGESLFWAMQSASFLLNPPYALSIIVLLTGFYLWRRWETKINITKAMVLGLLFGSLMVIKAYAGLLIIIALLFGAALGLRSEKVRKKGTLLVLGLTAGVAFLIWVLWQRGSEFPFVFEPLWFIRTLFEASDRLFLPKMGEIWWILVDGWYKSPKFWAIAGFGAFLFFIGNFGTRIFGILKVTRNFWDNLLMVIIVTGSLIPMLFVQKGTAWNTVQFLYYALLFSNFFFAKYLSSLVDKKKYVLVAGLCLFSLPTSLGTVKDYLPNSPAAYISVNEIHALNFLRSEPTGSVLVAPYDPYAKDDKKAPFPLRIYETTAYVSAYSGKETFLEDEMNLDITGYAWRERRKEALQFFRTGDEIWSRGFLRNNSINYVYLAGNQILPLSEEKLGIKMIFDNEEVKIYKTL